MGQLSEAEELSHASFWDKRYDASNEQPEPTHEWFRGFESLKPWLQKHLFTPYPAEKNPIVLHLGSGDSVDLTSLILVSPSADFGCDDRLSHMIPMN
jgi:hypothetical protein